MPCPFRLCLCVAFVFLALLSQAESAVVNATWNSVTDVPVTANSYNATGNTVNFTLNFAPPTGTNLMVVNNTGLPFISGTFDNLAQGQAVTLIYGGKNYYYVANYYAGTGNDLVLLWASNRVFAWGSNGSGQLGDTTFNQRTIPVPVMATGVLADKTVIALSAGNSHSLALCSDGTVAAWGDNTNGQLGNNTTTASSTPVAVSAAAGVSALSGKTVVAISAGGYFSTALCSDGTLATWGRNDFGELGNNSTTQSNVPVLVNTNSGTSALYGKSVAAISNGYGYGAALCSDGTVVTWGHNLFGQLGNNSTTLSTVPVLVNAASGVSTLYGKTVVAIAAGWNMCMALCSDGSLASWGGNVYGRGQYHCAAQCSRGRQCGQRHLCAVWQNSLLYRCWLWAQPGVVHGWHAARLGGELRRPAWRHDNHQPSGGGGGERGQRCLGPLW